MATDTLIDDAPNTKDTPHDRASKPKAPPKQRSAPRQTPRQVGSVAKKTIPTSRAFLSGRVQNPERVIALEMIVAIAVYIGISVYEGSAPKPKVIAAMLAIFAILGLVTVFGPRWGRVAYLFGGLVLIGILFNKEVAIVAEKTGVSGKLSSSGNQTLSKAAQAASAAAQSPATTLIQTAAIGG